MQRKPLLAAKDLSWGYADHAPLGSGLTLRVYAGESIALVGPNGAGKTTLLKTLAGLIPTHSGTLSLGDADIRSLSSRDRARRVALLSAAGAIESGLTVKELVALGRTPYLSSWGRTSRADEESVSSAIVACNLNDLADRRLTTLSEGERQRAHIAVVVAQNAPIALLDEPSSHLDLHWRYRFYELMRHLRRETGMAVILVSHDLADAFRESDRVLLLTGGQIEECDDRSDIKCTVRLAAAFEVPQSRIMIPSADDERY